MKVIVAGYSKTGTKTINAALAHLGYEVYDCMDHFWYHEKEWTKIFKEGGTISDFKKMYENVDAAVDIPVYLFWEEISKAFPNAKIIYSTRDADFWADRISKQILDTSKATILRAIFYFLSSTGRRLQRFAALYHPLAFANSISIFSGNRLNKTLIKKRFKEHRSHILQSAPKNRLLIYNIKQGWEPLCQFLEKEIPNMPFPWLNKDGSYVMQMVWRHPAGKQMKKELFVSFVLLLTSFVLVLYVILKYC